MKINVAKIKLILADRKMTLGEFADLSGISRQAICAIFKRGTCTIKTAGKLADGLEISVTEIVEEE